MCAAGRCGWTGPRAERAAGQTSQCMHASGLWEEEESKVEWIGGGGCQRRACQSDGELRGGQKQARCMNAGGGASCVAMQAGGRGKRAWRLGKGEGQGSMRCALSRMTVRWLIFSECGLGSPLAGEKRGNEPASARKPDVAPGWAVPPRWPEWPPPRASQGQRAQVQGALARLSGGARCPRRGQQSCAACSSCCCRCRWQRRTCLCGGRRGQQRRGRVSVLLQTKLVCKEATF